MIFAEMRYPGAYEDFHDELGTFLATRFPQVQSGLQGDSWFWITHGGEKVAIDTFGSMKHQVKAGTPGPHVQAVIAALRSRYDVHVHAEPLPEPHED